MTIRTDAAAAALGRRQITEPEALAIERLAEQGVSVHKTLGELGIDSLAQIKGSGPYEKLSAPGKAIFDRVYNEMLANAASGFNALAGAAVAAAPPVEKVSRERLEAAVTEVCGLLEAQTMPAMMSGFNLRHSNNISPRQNPELFLVFAEKVTGVIDSPQPHLLVTYKKDKVPEPMNLAASQLTPENFKTALLQALNGMFKDVPIRVQAEPI